MKKLLIAAAIALFATVTTASAGEKRYGNWTYEETLDPVSNTVKAMIYTKAIAGQTQWGETPHMMFTCKETKFGNLGVLNSEVFYLRHEAAPNEAFIRGSLSMDHSQVSTGWYSKNHWRSGRYKDHWDLAIKGGKMYAKFTPFSGPELIVTYSFNGFAQAVDHLAATCSH